MLAFPRLSDSGEDAKEKGTRKVGGEGKRKKEGIENAINRLKNVPECRLVITLVPEVFLEFFVLKFF